MQGFLALLFWVLVAVPILAVDARNLEGDRSRHSFNRVATNALPTAVGIGVLTADSDAFFSPFYEQFFKGKRESQGRIPPPIRQLGAGVLISSDGLILSGIRGLDDSEHLVISLSDGRTLPGQVVGTDPMLGLFLLRISAGRTPFLPLLRSNVVMGDWVVTLGRGVDGTGQMTMGVVGDIGLQASDGGDDSRRLRMDARINGVNAGGAVVGVSGALLGVIDGPDPAASGIVFVFPNEVLRRSVDKMLLTGPKGKGWPGIFISAGQPVMVDGLVRGGAADRAGLRKKDRLIRIGEVPVSTIKEANLALDQFPVGSPVDIELVRNNRRIVLHVLVPTASVFLPTDELKADRPKMGFRVQEMSVALKEQFNLSMKSGLVVTEVVSGSSASYAGIKPGDMIVEINQELVSDLARYRQRIDGLKRGTRVLVLVLSANDTRYVGVLVN